MHDEDDDLQYFFPILHNSFSHLSVGLENFPSLLLLYEKGI